MKTMIYTSRKLTFASFHFPQPIAALIQGTYFQSTHIFILNSWITERFLNLSGAYGLRKIENENKQKKKLHHHHPTPNSQDILFIFCYPLARIHYDELAFEGYTVFPV
jgi:hypothetical protein